MAKWVPTRTRRGEKWLEVDVGQGGDSSQFIYTIVLTLSLFSSTKQKSFPPLQPNTHERKLNLFYPPTNFLFSHFSTPPFLSLILKFKKKKKYYVFFFGKSLLEWFNIRWQCITPLRMAKWQFKPFFADTNLIFP